MMGFICLALAILGLLVLTKVSAVLGFILYLLAFILSLHTLRNQVAYDDTFSIFKFIKKISLKNFFEESVHTIIVICLPIVMIIGCYHWIYVDTFRFINSLY
ncbi:MAG: hypothetical protein IJN56_07420 [Clostridia bacterium]|nr:hypothetical protein [Clostridia bacterium]